MVRRSEGMHCFRREVRIGSRSQEVSWELDISVDIFSFVAGWKKEKSGG